MHEMDRIDQKIVELLSEGKSLSEIRTELKASGFKKEETRSVPKRVEAMKKYYGARSLYQLGIAIQKIKWENATESLIHKALEEGFTDGKNRMKRFALMVGIPCVIILCATTYYLATLF